MRTDEWADAVSMKLLVNIVAPRWREAAWLPGSSSEWVCVCCDRRVVLEPRSITVLTDERVNAMVFCTECVVILP